jgi:hypothetical protein
MASGRIKALFCLGLVWLLAGPAAAVDTPTPTILSGGGATWQVTNSGGTNNGLPTGTSDFSPGLTVDTTTLGTKDDAFDNGLTVWVDNVIFALPDPPATVDVTGPVVTAGPVLLSGLNVTVEYRAIQTSPTLRTLVSFQNPTASPISVTVSWVSNVGSDAQTTVEGSSSGDTTFNTADRWLVTSGGALDPTDVINTFVLGGPGSPVSPRTAASLTAFTDAGGGGSQGVTTTYGVTVPAGETRYLLFFNQVSETPAAALTAAAVFNDNPLLTSDFMAGIVDAQLPHILNWDFLAPPTESGTFFTLTPCRVADTRGPAGPSGGPALAANTTRTFPAAGVCGIPGDAVAIAINVTVVEETDVGDLRLYAAGGAVPTASTINFTANHVRANNAIIPLGTGGEIAVQTDMPTGTTQFLFDVTGYFK